VGLFLTALVAVVARKQEAVEMEIHCIGLGEIGVVGCCIDLGEIGAVGCCIDLDEPEAVVNHIGLDGPEAVGYYTGQVEE
jgi:hypothetical protein